MGAVSSLLGGGGALRPGLHHRSTAVFGEVPATDAEPKQAEAARGGVILQQITILPRQMKRLYGRPSPLL